MGTEEEISFISCTYPWSGQLFCMVLRYGARTEAQQVVGRLASLQRTACFAITEAVGGPRQVRLLN